jgi:hypothetical protein
LRELPREAAIAQVSVLIEVLQRVFESDDPEVRSEVISAVLILRNVLEPPQIQFFAAALLQSLSKRGITEFEYRIFLDFIGTMMQNSNPSVCDIGMTLLREITESCNPVIQESNFDDYFELFLGIARHSLFINVDWHHSVLIPLLLRKLDEQPLFFGDGIFRLFSKAFKLQTLSEAEASGIIDRGISRLAVQEFQCEVPNVLCCFCSAFRYSQFAADFILLQFESLVALWNSKVIKVPNFLATLLLALSSRLDEILADFLMELLSCPISAGASCFDFHLMTIGLYVANSELLNNALCEAIALQLYEYLSLRIPFRKEISVPMVVEWARRLDPHGTVIEKCSRRQMYVKSLIS